MDLIADLCNSTSLKHTMKQNLIGIGEILWDLFPSGKQIGGAPANFAHHVCNLGGEGVIVSRVGKDELGGELISDLESVGMITRYVSLDDQYPTGTVTVNVDQFGTPVFIVEEDVAWDYLQFGSDWVDLAESADVVCFGSLAQRTPISSAEIQNFLQRTSQSTLRIFDINLRPPYFSAKVIERSLELANVLKLNETELGYLGDHFALRGDATTQCLLLAERFRLQMVALTRGDSGSLLVSEGHYSEHEGYSVVVVDTVGAGDAFTAVLALGMLRGYELERINEIANRVASFVSTRPGGTPSLPDELCCLF